MSSPCAGTGFAVISIGDTGVVGLGDTGTEGGGEAGVEGDVLSGDGERISVEDEAGLVVEGSVCWGVEQLNRIAMRIRRAVIMGSLFMG